MPGEGNLDKLLQNMNPEMHDLLQHTGKTKKFQLRSSRCTSSVNAKERLSSYGARGS